MFLNDNETAVDLLQYEPIARCVVSLIERTQDAPITIGVHGDWGAGKSSVLKMVEIAMAGNSKIVCIRFNGWTFQGFEDAKVAILQSIVGEIERARPTTVELKFKVRKLIKRINWLKVAKKVGGIGFTLATGIPTPDQLSDLASIAQSVLAKGKEAMTSTDASQLAESAGEMLDEAEASDVPTEIQRFREDFKALLDEAKIAQLVILVDDLDRCLPNTIIETLEAIRLFLFVDRSAFVIAVDEMMVEYAVKQHFPDLPSSVTAAGYARNYLEKLIQVPVRVPALGPAETRTYLSLLLIENQLNNSTAFEPYLKLGRELLAKPWSTHGLDHATVSAKIGQVPAGVAQALTLSAQLTPILTEGTKGNPRQLKRFLNAMLMREAIARARGFDTAIERPALAKLMLLERFGHAAYETVINSLAGSPDGKLPSLAVLEGDKSGGIPAESGAFADWPPDDTVKGWLTLRPILGALDLRPYAFLTRDKRAYSGAAATLGPLEPLFDKLNSGSMSLVRVRKEVEPLKDAEARLLFNALREALLGTPDFKSRPAAANGIALLATVHK